MKRIKKTKILPFVIWGIWLIITFYFLEQNAEDSSQVSGSLTEFLMRLFHIAEINREAFEHVIRKLAHFCSFVGSGFLGTIALRMLSIKKLLAVLIPLHAILATSSELLQTLAEGRFCSVTDMLIDFSGSCLGISVCILFLHLLKRYVRKHRHDQLS